MYLLRRTAARAFCSPAKSAFAKPRSITTVAPVSFRSRQQQWISPALQRRFVSDDATKAATGVTETAEEAAAEAENFAQTVPEAPVEDNLTPAQQVAQAPPTDSSATVGVDALEAAAAGRGTAQEQGKKPYEAPPASNTLYVGNLYYEVTEEQLKRVFSRFGQVESIKVVYDNRGMSRGFAYVQYQDVNDAQVAVQNLDMQVFEGRNLVVQFHRPKRNQQRTSNGAISPHPPSRTLFIGNMSFEMSDRDLNDMFRDIRNVMDVRVAIDRRTGQPRGFAHADFIDVASATKAKEVLSEKVIYGRRLRIDFSKSSTHLKKSRPDRNDSQDVV